MADSSVSMSGPVRIESDARHRVAFDLAIKISSHESNDNKDRKYWLTLYFQSLRAMGTGSLESILKVG